MAPKNLSAKTVIAIITVLVGAAKTIVELAEADKKNETTNTNLLNK
jgi:hypothetical protein